LPAGRDVVATTAQIEKARVTLRLNQSLNDLTFPQAQRSGVRVSNSDDRDFGHQRSVPRKWADRVGRDHDDSGVTDPGTTFEFHPLCQAERG